MGLVNYGLVDGTGNKIDPLKTNANKKIVVSRYKFTRILEKVYRSHAGKVQELVNKTFGHDYLVEPAGGSGYKTLRLIQNTAGKIFYIKV